MRKPRACRTQTSGSRPLEQVCCSQIRDSFKGARMHDSYLRLTLALRLLHNRLINVDARPSLSERFCISVLEKVHPKRYAFCRAQLMVCQCLWQYETVGLCARSEKRLIQCRKFGAKPNRSLAAPRLAKCPPVNELCASTHTVSARFWCALPESERLPLCAECPRTSSQGSPERAWRVV